jgi:hypothetical protein
MISSLPITTRFMGGVRIPAPGTQDDIKAQAAYETLKRYISTKQAQDNKFKGLALELGALLPDSNMTIMAPEDQYQDGLALLRSIPGMSPVPGQSSQGSDCNDMNFTSPENQYSLTIRYMVPGTMVFL